MYSISMYSKEEDKKVLIKYVLKALEENNMNTKGFIEYVQCHDFIDIIREANWLIQACNFVKSGKN